LSKDVYTYGQAINQEIHFLFIRFEIFGYHEAKSLKNGSSRTELAAVLVFLMFSPEPLLIEKLMMKLTTKADRIPSAGYGLIAI